MRGPKKIFIFLFLLAFSFTQERVFGNSTNIDSLESILKIDQNTEAKFAARNQLAEHYFQFNIHTSLDFINENLQTPELKNFPRLLNHTYYLKGRAHLLFSDLSEGENYLNRAKVYFEKNNDFVSLGKCYKDLGTIQLRRNQFDEAEKFYQKGIEAFEKGNYKIGVAHCTLNLGNVYVDQFSYSKAVNFYYNALREYEKLNLNRYVGMVNNNIGNIYKDIQNFPKAHEHYQKACKSYQIDNDSLQMVNANLNIGATYLDEGNYDQAIQILYQALHDAKKTGFTYPIPMIYNNIVACHINLGNFDLARKNIELARKVGQSNLNIIEVTRTHLWDAEIQFRQENYQSAIKNALLAYQTAEENNQVDILADASRILSESYKSKGQYKQGFEYLELNQIWQDSLFNEDEMKIPLSKDFEYQLEKQKREQELQQEKNKLAYESEIKFQKLILSFFILAFLVIGMAAFAFYKNYNAKKKAEKELAKKNTMLQKYIESNIQLEQFAHIASHDLKSPLRTVGSFSSLLKRRAASKLNENEIEYLDMIENAAKLMWNLVDDLMAYSQVNSLQMNLKQHDINNLIQEVLSNLNFSIEEKNAEIVISNMPTQVKVDETKIRQVFQNLIANSLKFMPKDRQPNIEINCKEENDFYKFSINDNGIGIQEEYLETIFKPYKQLHTKDKFEGTGMGLAICKKIVEKHGGEIAVESTFGEGTTFYFTIPISTNSIEAPKEEMVTLA